MMKCTKTRDEQDRDAPYKPFPKRRYFKAIWDVWKREPIIYIEKSRSVMLTWCVSAFCLHEAMANRATTVLFLGPDEDRTLNPIEYCWTLWENQEDVFKAAWPVLRKVREPFNPLKLANDSMLLALPGKDPDKIRSEHPTIIVMDEAAHIERGSEAHDIALATKCKKFVALTSANPGWFRQKTKGAVPSEWDYGA